MKAALFFPWGDLVERKSGASQRVGLLIDFLRERCEEIRVFSAGHSKDFADGNVKYFYFAYKTEPGFFGGLLRDIFSPLTCGEDFMLRYHYRFRFDRAFIKQVRKLVDWADIIFLEYTFWAVPVVKAAKSKNKKVILSAHDILSDQIKKSRLVKRLTLNEEIKALRMADHAVCVSASDRDFFRRYGVNATLIPHGLDTRKCKKSLDRKSLTDRIEKLRIPSRNVCFFVGSLFDANVRAVRFIKNLAEKMRDTGVSFVVAGGCANAERLENFFALGRVGAEDLKALYQTAQIVLVPLLEGTGSSVKTIEAMAYGKVLLGTALGFRGYPVETGLNCIISDDLSGYPSIIKGILDDPERKRLIEANAARFAEDYDYRRLYERYRELMQPSCDGFTAFD